MAQQHFNYDGAFLNSLLTFAIFELKVHVGE